VPIIRNVVGLMRNVTGDVEAAGMAFDAFSGSNDVLNPEQHAAISTP
jgi:hypothetical protein